MIDFFGYYLIFDDTVSEPKRKLNETVLESSDKAGTKARH